MQPREHLELAAWVALHAPTLIRDDRVVPCQPFNRYWSASKARWGRWMRTMKRLGQTPTPWPLARALLEEILASEVPARVWAAAVVAWDQQAGRGDGEPVVRSVLTAHEEARRRGLRLLLHSAGVPSEAAMRLNTFRRQIDRWADLLVGWLARWHDVSSLAGDPPRAREFAEDFDDHPGWKQGHTAWRLLMTGLGNLPRSRVVTGNDDFNAAVFAAILECFPAEEFEPDTIGPSVWLHRFWWQARQTHGMVDELCRLEFE